MRNEDFAWCLSILWVICKGFRAMRVKEKGRGKRLERHAGENELESEERKEREGVENDESLLRSYSFLFDSKS